MTLSGASSEPRAEAAREEPAPDTMPQISWPWVVLFLAAVVAFPWLGIVVWFGVNRLTTVLSGL